MKKTATAKQVPARAEKPARREPGAKPARAKQASQHPTVSAAHDAVGAAPGDKSSRTKADTIIELLRQEAGATLPDLCAATGWQAHSVRGFLSATVKKRLNLDLISTPVEGGNRRYRIGQRAAETA